MNPKAKIVLLGGTPKTSFELALKTSLVPEKAVSGTATFTRSSTKTVIDFEGLSKTCKAGEIPETGARRVENLATFSNTFDNAVWTKSIVGSDAVIPTITSGFLDKDGGYTAWRLVCDRGSVDSNQSMLRQTPILAAGLSQCTSLWVRSNTGINQNLMLGFYTASVVVVTPVWKRVSNSMTSINVMDIGSRGAASNRNIDILIACAMAENITGQANQNPSEYVSNAVLSAPYHGAGCDGVKYFPYQNGNTVTSNVVTEAVGAAIADSTLKGVLIEGSRTNSLLQSINLLSATNWL